MVEGSAVLSTCKKERLKLSLSLTLGLSLSLSLTLTLTWKKESLKQMFISRAAKVWKRSTLCASSGTSAKIET